MAKQDGAKQKDPPIIHGESISQRLYSVKIGERRNVGGAPHLLETLGGQAQRFPVLTGAHPSEGPLDPLATVVSHVAVELGCEILQADALPVPAVEELEAPMYVNSLFSPEISARHRILPGTERSSGGRSQRSLPFGIRR